MSNNYSEGKPKKLSFLDVEELRTEISVLTSALKLGYAVERPHSSSISTFLELMIDLSLQLGNKLQAGPVNWQDKLNPGIAPETKARSDSRSRQAKGRNPFVVPLSGDYSTGFMRKIIFREDPDLLPELGKYFKSLATDLAFIRRHKKAPRISSPKENSDSPNNKSRSKIYHYNRRNRLKKHKNH